LKSSDQGLWKDRPSNSHSLTVNPPPYRSYLGGVASRLAIVIYVAMVMPILPGNSYSPNDSKLKYASYWLF